MAKDKIGQVLWITGFSGAGKTTLATALMPYLGPRSVLLDGDELREALGVTNYGFDRENRRRLAFTYARLALMLAKQGFTVVVATISLFHDLHAWNRENLPGYIEIWLEVPGEELRKRDPKGLYAASACGKIQDMACAQIIEVPHSPHLILHTEEHTNVTTHVQQVIALVQKFDIV